MNKTAGFFALFAVTAVLAVWFLGGRAIAVEAAYPVEKAAGAVERGFMARCRALWSRQKLGPVIEDLREKAEFLEILRADNQRLAAENARLRTALAYPARLPGDWVAAPVLGRNGTEGVKGILRVGKGSLDGVKKGAAVVARDGVVGRVDEVSPHTAVVRLVSDPSMKISCEVETAPGVEGVVRSIVSGSSARRVLGDDSAGVVFLVNPYRLDHVRPDAVCEKGARLVTSGLGGVYPPGIAIGFLIDTTRDDDTKLECEGTVKPAVDFAALEDVFIRRES